MIIGYKDTIKTSMEQLAALPDTVFIGYNLKYGSKMYGTMSDVSNERILEMPVAEALMIGMATGMALAGMLPVLIFERMDFMLLASDQIINHLSRIMTLSKGQYNPKVIIRAIVGASKPFNPGPQHLGNYVTFFRHECFFPVIDAIDVCSLRRGYEYSLDAEWPSSVMICEHRELY